MFRLSFVFIILVCSCSTKQESSAGDPHFFNIEDFLSTEISYLDSLKPDVIKTAILNNKEEVIEIEGAQMNWEKELSQFNILQIDKAALWEKFNVDSFQDNGKMTIRYIGKNPKLRVKEFILTQREGKVVEFTAKSSVKNILQSTSRKWSYRSGGEIYIEGLNKILFMEPQKYSVTIATRD
ncbi:MAG: hypothetical protein HKN92_09840 [Chitinophagales bacterium]|nr:hypothetical protein [Chitinophagales bacterium]